MAKFILELPLLSWLWCQMCMSVWHFFKQIKSTWTDNCGSFFISLSLLFIFAFFCQQQVHFLQCDRDTKHVSSPLRTPWLSYELYLDWGWGNLGLNLSSKIKKKLSAVTKSTHMPTAWIYSSISSISVYNTDYCILQMAGTQLNYLNQPAKNNRSDIITCSSASYREKIHTAYPLKYPILVATVKACWDDSVYFGFTQLTKINNDVVYWHVIH